MADDKIISIGFEAKPGNAAQQAEAAGTQTGNAFVRGANEALKKLNTDVANKFKAEGGKSFLDNLFDISKSKADAAAKTISDSVSAVMPKVGQFLPAVPKETLSDIERATLGINSFLTGVQSFATFFDKNASVLASFQLGGQAFDYAQRYRRAQADAAAAARVARAEAAVSRASSADIVGEMAGGGLRTAALGTGGEIEAAAFGAGGAVAASSRLSALVKTVGEAAAVIGTGAAVIGTAVKARNAVLDEATESAEKFQRTKLLRDVTGFSPKELEEQRTSLELVGGKASDLDNAFYRLALRARRSMPEIAHEVEESSDRQIEADIKVEASGRALANAHDNVALAVDRAKKAQGELVKVQQTEQQRMEQERRSADLAVSGAQLGERGAQMRATQAAINLRAAPEQARIAEIQGPLTVRGAELGAEGARIALAEARERYYGQDPSQDEALQERKRAHALQVAINNADQAEVQERQARLNERKRREERAAGVGPEAQAALQAAQAGQAQEMAELQTQRVELARETLKIEQDNHDYAAREREAHAAADKARRDVKGAADEERLAAVQDRDAIRARARFAAKDVASVQKAITGEGPPIPIGEIGEETLRKAITGLGGGEPKGIIAALRQFRDSPLLRDLPEGKRAREVFSAAQTLLGRGGLGGEAGQLTDLIMSGKQIPKDMQDRIDARFGDQAKNEARMQKAQEQTYKIFEDTARGNQRVREEQRKADAAAREIAAGGGEAQRQQDRENMQRVRTLGIQGYAGIENLLTQPDKVLGAAIDAQRQRQSDVQGRKPSDEISSFLGDLRSALSQLVNAIRGGASDVSGAKKSSGAGSGTGATATEVTNNQEAVGGMLHGLGSGTSDQIPIMASPGEYVIKAETASRLGEPFLNSLNAGHFFAEGGSVGKDDGGFGPWAAIIKSAQWGIWAARMGLPAVGVTVPAMADVALARSNPLISAALALKAIWDETHSHPPETLGEVLREQRGGMSVNELMAKHFAETRQATFDERFPSDADKAGDQPSTSDQQPPADTFAQRFSGTDSDTFAQRFGDADGLAGGGAVAGAIASFNRRFLKQDPYSGSYALDKNTSAADVADLWALVTDPAYPDSHDKRVLIDALYQHGEQSGFAEGGNVNRERRRKIAAGLNPEGKGRQESLSRLAPGLNPEGGGRHEEMNTYQGGGSVAHGPAHDATITRNPFVSSSDLSYQDRVLMEHDGFDPDNPNDVAVWRKYIGSRIPPNMGMPGGPTGAGAIARPQIARGPAPPILMVKPGAGKNYTIPTPGGGADVRYNPLAGTYWPEGSGKPYDEKDQTTFGKQGVKFDPMNSSTWSPGYMNDFYRAPGYTDIKTSDKDLATPIHFGRRRDSEPEAQPAQVTIQNKAEDEPAKIQQMIQSSQEDERKRIEEDQNKYQEATGGLIRRYFGGGRVGMQAGGFPPAPDMGGAITAAALHDLSSRLGHIPSSGRGLTPSASALSGLNTLGVHQLDLRTNAGVFSAAVSEETMEAIRNSSLMSKISSAGSRPTWYS